MKVWVVLLLTLGVAALGIAFAILSDAPSRRELPIGSIDFTKLQNGTYIGEYKGKEGNSRDATVEVTISEGRISDIKTRKGALDKYGNPLELTAGMTINDLFRQGTEKKSLQVDAISGATLTSKAHLKALENALKQAQKE